MGVTVVTNDKALQGIDQAYTSNCFLAGNNPVELNFAPSNNTFSSETSPTCPVLPATKK